MGVLEFENCQLCPRRCQVDRTSGTRGVCGATDELIVARAALHEWEEPPISVGAGSGTVFFAHCPLRCIYCQNKEIAHNGVGQSISIERLSEIFLELQQAGAANINLVTPTHYAPHIVSALTAARTAGLVLPVVYNTSGYERAACIEAVAPSIDVFLTDFKYLDAHESDAAARYSRAPDYYASALEALDAMVAATGKPVFDTWEGDARLVRGVVVRHLLLPGREEESKLLIGRLFERYGQQVLYSLMSQYTPLEPLVEAPELNEPVSDHAYEEFLEYCDAIGMSDYYWQQGPAASESFIPAFDGTGVTRTY